MTWTGAFSPSGKTYLAVDPASGKEHTVVNIPSGEGRQDIVETLTDNHLLLAAGPDLAAIDVHTGEVLAFERNFLKKQDPWHRNLMPARLLVDGDRLLVIPGRFGGDVKVIDLKALNGRLEADSLLKRTENVLRAALADLGPAAH